jgi:hypothetical protein
MPAMQGETSRLVLLTAILAAEACAQTNPGRAPKPGVAEGGDFTERLAFGWTISPRKAPETRRPVRSALRMHRSRRGNRSSAPAPRYRPRLSARAASRRGSRFVFPGQARIAEPDTGRVRLSLSFQYAGRSRSTGDSGRTAAATDSISQEYWHAAESPSARIRTRAISCSDRPQDLRT